MTSLTNPLSSLSAELAHRVEAFEQALASNPGADLAAHLPPLAHLLYLPVLSELIRVDLEWAWSNGQPKFVADYTARFPALLTNAMVLAGVAFEEYRQRVRAGESVVPQEYELKFAVDTSGWSAVGPDSSGLLAASTGISVELSDEDAKTAAVPGLCITQNRRLPAPLPRAARERQLSDAESLACQQEAAAALPAIGTEFVGFHLVGELGRGAFGRVYLARQGDLAGRPVALKVASGLGAESNALAQLQHPNIVPIYSYHRAGPFQAVCMPYLGGTTLAQVIKEFATRKGVPSSGKELRSTLAKGRSDTATGSRPADSQPRSTTAPGSGVRASPLPTADIEEGEGWARLEGLPYVEAVLALGGQLADGLTHAHRRGILHRDLKPANVLLTDDGRAMLLDFNLAEDTKLRGSAERATIGGTLPYMAPEQLEAFRTARGTLDGRCDLYGVGVILFELLGGKHPFPVRKGPSALLVPQMITDRKQGPPSLRALNPAVSPGAESIVRKCLAADPADRYQHAEDLREDIDRHLANRPLKHAADPSWRERARKWARRHPRLASSGTVAAVAVLLLAFVVGGAMYTRERTRAAEARGQYADHQTAFRAAQAFLDDSTQSSARLDEGEEMLRGVLARYGVPDDPDAGDAWLSAPALRYLPEADRERVRGDIGETFFLLAQVAVAKGAAATDPAERGAHAERAARWNALASRYGESRLPRAVREQAVAIAELRADREAAERFRKEAEEVPLSSARDLYLAGTQLARQGRFRDALRHLERSTQLDPTNPSAWFLRGVAHLSLGQDELATMAFGACVALRPDFAPAWLNRAFAFYRLRLFPQAHADYDRALALDPKLTEAYIQRAELREAAGDRKGAIEDYTRALDTGAATARVYFKRATAKHLLGDLDGAQADRAAGFRITPTDELSWIARAENRLLDDPKHGLVPDPKAALIDVDEALKVNPWSVYGLQLKAHILAERLNRPEDAVAVLDRAVQLYPDYVPARAGRGVLLARAGKRTPALQDAEDALRRDTRAPNLYQVGCIYALLAKDNPDDKREARKLLWDALKTGFALDIVDTDPDLAALRKDRAFQNLVQDAKDLDAARKQKK